MLVPPGLRLVGAYAAASEESPAKLAALARQLGELLPPHLVCDQRFVVPLADTLCPAAFCSQALQAITRTHRAALDSHTVPRLAAVRCLVLSPLV